MDDHAFIERMMASHPVFAANPPGIWGSEYYYATVRDWAGLFAGAVVGGEVARSELRKVMAVCEDALAGGDALAHELVYDDFFNIMQGHFYCRLEAARRLEAALGPRCRGLWEDMIEDGVGPGIRDVETWSAVVRNGGVESFRREGPDGVLELARGDLDDEAFDEATRWLVPLVATAWVGERDALERKQPGLVFWESEPVATLEIEATDRPDVTVYYGSLSDRGGRWIVCGEDVFVGRGWWEDV